MTGPMTSQITPCTNTTPALVAQALSGMYQVEKSWIITDAAVEYVMPVFLCAVIIYMYVEPHKRVFSVKTL